MSDQKPMDLDRRLRLLGWADIDASALRALGPFLEEHISAALDAFYGRMRHHPELVAMFSGEAGMLHAKEKQAEHWKMLATGDFGPDYVAAVERVGNIHSKIGLDPGRYISGYYSVAETFIDALVARTERAQETRRWGSGKPPDLEPLARDLKALLKAMFVDMDLSVSVYQRRNNELFEERDAAQAQLLSDQSHALAELGAVITALSDRDLTAEVPGGLPEEFREITERLSIAMQEVSDALARVRNSGEVVRGGASTIMEQIGRLSVRTEQSAANLEQSSAALTEISTSVSKSAENSQETASRVRDARQKTERSGQVMEEAVVAIHEIRESSSKIAKIVQMIDEIAFQTNLLALNAAVEAARAGESGKGFAVVAGEVRALAQRCLDAATQITRLIEDSSGKVETGVRLVESTGSELRTIVDIFAEIDSLVSDIAEASSEQARGLAEVNAAVNDLDTITQENTQMADRTRSSAHELSDVMETLSAEIGSFRTRDRRPAPPLRDAG